MKPQLLSILSAVAAALFSNTCLASSDATCIIYQPIEMRSEGTVIKLPKEGFIIFPVPYISAFSIPEKPYSAITRPYTMLSMRNPKNPSDSNLVSRAGVKIQSDCTFEGNKLKEEVVTVDFLKFKAADYEPSLEVIAEATLECIRLTATDKHQNWRRPVLKIIGKPKDKAMWKSWEKAFNTQDFTKPFKRPKALPEPSKE